MQNKYPWQSKTVVVNAVIGGAALVALFFPGAVQVPAWLNAHVAEVGAFWSVANIALRAFGSNISLGD